MNFFLLSALMCISTTAANSLPQSIRPQCLNKCPTGYSHDPKGPWCNCNLFNESLATTTKLHGPCVADCKVGYHLQRGPTGCFCVPDIPVTSGPCVKDCKVGYHLQRGPKGCICVPYIINIPEIKFNKTFIQPNPICLMVMCPTGTCSQYNGPYTCPTCGPCGNSSLY